MTGPYQHAAIARCQREDVSWRHDVVCGLGRIDGHCNGARAVAGGDAGRDALASLNGKGEGRAETAVVLACHGLELELVGACPTKGKTDQAARMGRHEVDLGGRGELGGNDDVALVLAIVGIDQDVGTAVDGVLDDILDR